MHVLPQVVIVPHADSTIAAISQFLTSNESRDVFIALQVNVLAAQVRAYYMVGLTGPETFDLRCFQRCLAPYRGVKRLFEFGCPLQESLIVSWEIAQLGGAPISERVTSCSLTENFDRLKSLKISTGFETLNVEVTPTRSSRLGTDKS